METNEYNFNNIVPCSFPIIKNVIKIINHPLTIACYVGSKEIVKLLLTHNANIQIENGYLTLICAITNNIDMLKYLIEEGLDITPKIHSALVISKNLRNMIMIDFFLSKGGNEYNVVFYLSSKKQDYETCKELIINNYNIDINHKAEYLHDGLEYLDKKYPIEHFLLCRNSDEIIDFFLQNGANKAYVPDNYVRLAKRIFEMKNKTLINNFFLNYRKGDWDSKSSCYNKRLTFDITQFDDKYDEVLENLRNNDFQFDCITDYYKLICDFLVNKPYLFEIFFVHEAQSYIQHYPLEISNLLKKYKTKNLIHVHMIHNSDENRMSQKIMFCLKHYNSNCVINDTIIHSIKCNNENIYLWLDSHSNPNITFENWSVITIFVISNITKFKEINETQIMKYILEKLSSHPSLIESFVIQLLKNQKTYIMENIFNIKFLNINTNTDNNTLDIIKLYFIKHSFESNSIHMLSIMKYMNEDENNDIIESWSEHIDKLYKLIKKAKRGKRIKKIKKINKLENEVLKPLLSKYKRQIIEHAFKQSSIDYKLIVHLYVCDCVDFASEFTEEQIEKIVRKFVISYRRPKDIYLCKDFAKLIEKSGFDFKSFFIQSKLCCVIYFYENAKKYTNLIDSFDDYVLSKSVVPV